MVLEGHRNYLQLRVPIGCTWPTWRVHTSKSLSSIALMTIRALHPSLILALLHFTFFSSTFSLAQDIALARVSALWHEVLWGFLYPCFEQTKTFQTFHDLFVMLEDLRTLNHTQFTYLLESCGASSIFWNFIFNLGIKDSSYQIGTTPLQHH